MDTITSRRTQARPPPRDFFVALRARPRTDAENAILRAEIKRRHTARERRYLADPHRFTVLTRLDDLEVFFLARYGLELPDDDAGWDDLTIVAHHFVHLPFSAAKIIARIVEWAALWAPAFPTDKVTKLARQAVAKPKKWKADTLARKLGLTMMQRTMLRIKTIGACDVKREDRPAWLAEHHRQRKEAERRANGIGPREQYLAGTIEATRPHGISRTTWWRRRKAACETACETASETGPAAYKERVSSAGPVSPTTSSGGSATPEGPGRGQVPLSQRGSLKQKRLANEEVWASTSPRQPAAEPARQRVAELEEQIERLHRKLAEQDDTSVVITKRHNRSNR